MQQNERSMERIERVTNLLEGKPTERVLLYPFLLGFCAHNVGYPLSSIYDNAEKSFEAQLKTLEQYGFDWGPMYGYASYGAWEFGGDINMPRGEYEQAPSIARFPVTCEEDVERLKLPDATTSGSLPIAIKFARLQAENGMPITPIVGGSFTLAGNICSPKNLCRWMLKKPGLAHEVLRKATSHILDTVKCWVDAFGAENIVPQFWEPLASNDIISEKQFQYFAMGYLQEASEKILRLGVKHIFYHICGEQNSNLRYWKEVPMGDPGICSFGKEVDIDTAVKYFGRRCIIVGNIDPQLIKGGAPEQVHETCRIAIEKGRKAPRGFMLSSGCETPPDSVPYNIRMMRKAVDDYGTFS